MKIKYFEYIPKKVRREVSDLENCEFPSENFVLTFEDGPVKKIEVVFEKKPQINGGDSKYLMDYTTFVYVVKFRDGRKKETVKDIQQSDAVRWNQYLSEKIKDILSDYEKKASAA